MTKTYVSIKAQIRRLEEEAQALKSKEKLGVIQRIREAISVYELGVEDLFGSQSAARGKRGRPKLAAGDASGSSSAAAAKRSIRRGGVKQRSVPIKYADGTGNVWSGRGSQPRWLRDALSKGKSLESFLVKQS